MKKMNFLFAVLFIPFLLLANGNQQSAENASVNQKAKKVFSSNTDIISKNCSWECRDVNSGYVTQISGFDFKNGRTFCKVFDETNLTQDLGIEAGKRVTGCNIPNLANQYQDIINSSKKFQISSNIKFQQDEKNITMTKFLTALVTLNPNIINRDETEARGEIVLQDGIKPMSIWTFMKNFEQKQFRPLDTEPGSFWDSVQNYVGDTIKKGAKMVKDSGLESTGEFIEDTLLTTTYETNYLSTSALDGFNKNNMAYFSNLFLANEKIYQHLQIFLFMLVGGFFVTQIGANKLQAYLENRGQSSSNEPYLHKFYIPLLMVGTFFMPIPEANGKAHSTIMQNVIRYFTIHSTNLADMANAVGAETYMNKIYKSLGGLSNDGIGLLIADKSINNFIIEKGNEIYEKTCLERYEEKLGSFNTSSLNYQLLNEEQKEELRKNYTENDVNGKAGTKEDISFEACILLEVQIKEAYQQNTRLDSQFEEIRKFHSSGGARERLNEIDKYFANRDRQLGWADSILIPSSAILAETFAFAKDQIAKDDMKKSTEANIKNTMDAERKGDVSRGADDISNSTLGWIAGQLVWMMLPGASAIKEFALERPKEMGMAIGGAIGDEKGGSWYHMAGGAAAGYVAGRYSPSLVAYTSAIIILQWTFEKIPLLVCTTASLIAFVSYLVSLCKYFYISPFVVAWGMATRQMNKIVQFLVTGIAIFLKPVLIVLFIYLALFVHTLIDELFLFLSIQQFSGIETGTLNFYTNFITGAITGLLAMFGKLASAYIMWKLIISGSSWALSLVGIDGKQDDMIASGIESNLARRAFIA
ncbi:hypothetical protein T36_2205 (plasmid) [Helicobacter cinaedi]|uniref:hypothetical protein n=1 Tax=Helicobacter cinaedi TaxID=213 RepID=UPI001F47FDC2|nr:hypothetical protein [Helicobacter cinaedi]BDB65726.1 hypothetical protein T36_2205 [Helicobacter cinaedi]